MESGIHLALLLLFPGQVNRTEHAMKILHIIGMHKLDNGMLSEL